MPALPLPQPRKGITQPAGRPGRVGGIGQQASTGVTHHAASVRAHSDLERVLAAFTLRVPSARDG